MNLFKQKPFPELCTPRLLLRAVSLTDSSTYHGILSHPEVSRYSDVPDNPTRKRNRTFVHKMSRLHLQKKGIAWGVVLNGTEQLVGSVRINNLDKKANIGVVVYELHPDYWNTGIATEALSLVVNYAHTTMQLNRLEAWTSTDNIASRKVLLNNGFTHEGTQREKAWFQDKLWDVELYARLASDSIPNKE